MTTPSQVRPKANYLTMLQKARLDSACVPIVEAFGHHPYLVGSCTTTRDFRDVDVRLMLPDDEFDELFAERPHLWALLVRLITEHLTAGTGLPVDFQIQRQTEANERHGGSHRRHPLAMGALYAGGGDATPFDPWGGHR